LLAIVGLTAATGGCSASTMRVASLDELERVRATDDAHAAAVQAPEVYARAERERSLARTAHERGDDVTANLHAERAIAAYGHARATRRLAVAIANLADSQKAIDDATSQEQSLAAIRAKLEFEAQDLERRAQVARDRLLPARSFEAAADRDAARSSAARSLAVEARLLCGAARLVTADAAGLADAECNVDALDAKLGQPPASKGVVPPLVDEAGAARARCLDVLTRAQRSGGHGDGPADTLLAELSASGGWDPTRDERGIVVTVRGVFAGGFAGTMLTDDGAAKLEKLGRVAAAHPGVGVQLIVHDAQAPGARDDGHADRDNRRADAVAKALVAGGAPAARLKTERAGNRTPLVDPYDGRLRDRNERVDVVFVTGG
jgi:outer membrane protein OmpA-like peptidoglycan-associated protein